MPWRAGAAVLAAAAALWLLWPRPPAVLVLAGGAQWVDGDARVAAGDVVVDVAGQAWIQVEPAAGVGRVGASEGPMTKTVLAGLAGAAVTVAVYEGTAVVRRDGAEPVVVPAGHTERTRPAAAPGAPPVTAVAAQAEVTRLEGELAAAKQALAESEFSGALARGQLAAMQGTPSPWPEDAPAALRPEAFRAGLEAQLAELPDVSVAELDCAEYPCVAALHYTGTAEEREWSQQLRDAMQDWLRASVPGGLSVSVNTSRFDQGDASEAYVIFGGYEGERESDVGQRTDFRIDAMVDQLGEQLRQR
ncbi:MAG: hypothetical protein R3F59_13695 [Myxococcota bacterium]